MATKKKVAPKTLKYIFDGKKLAADILAKRQMDDLSFAAISKAHGIPIHILYAMEAEKQVPSARNLASVLGWLDKWPGDYIYTK